MQYVTVYLFSPFVVHSFYSVFILFTSAPPAHRLLQMHWSQTQDFAPLHLLQLGAHDAVQSGADWIARLGDQHTGIIVELDNAAIWASKLLLGAHNDGMANVTATDLVGGRGTDGGGAWARLWTEVALLLDNYYYALA